MTNIGTDWNWLNDPNRVMILIWQFNFIRVNVETNYWSWLLGGG